MAEQTLRQQLLANARELNSSGLSCGKSGNISARCDEGLLITPSGVDYARLREQDLVLLDLQGQQLQGELAPSSEWRIHCDVYRHKPEARAIVHAHPTYSTALACTGRDIPAFHYMVAIAGGDNIPLAPYALFGSQALSDHVVDALQGRHACLMAHHGLIAHGHDLAAAMQLAREVETLAQQYCEALKLGQLKLLSKQQMQEALLQFGGYGQRI